MTCGIYCITHRDSGRRYVGLSVNISRRLSEHKRASLNSKDGYVIHRALAKYGVDAFDFEILEACDKPQLSDREVHWVSEFDSYENGFNLTPGGFSASRSIETRKKSSERPRTEADRKKYSDAAKARWADPVRRAQLMESRAGRAAPSEITRKRLSAALTIYLQSPEAKHQRSEQMRERFSTPEARAKQSAKLKIALFRPELREKRVAQLASITSAPGFKAQCSENMKARYSNPAARAAQSERLKSYWEMKRQIQGAPM